MYCQNTKIEFKPSISDVIGNLDIYDREETLGVYLDRFDPNNRADVCNLLKEMFFHGPNASELSISHKESLVESLISALRDPGFDFCKPFDTDDENGDTFTLPFSWEIKRSRLFFEEAYRIAMSEWHEVSINMPSFHELNIPLI
ncbi:hypothetical protein ACK34S_02815 [Aeromonas hydrophila]|uniref:hypothetical protein n=1 Tax=Aeromonas hydrophila TaxID=644 RepID=UPI0039874755